MGNDAPSGAKVDRRLEAEPVVAAGWRVQPVARLVGWASDNSGPSGSFISRVGRLTPLEAQVDNGEEQTILTMEDPMQEPLRGMATAGAVLTAICLIIMAAAQVASRRN